jgi:phospholipid/cholesterol/gamma-HCH transport system substrate-binding protein
METEQHYFKVGIFLTLGIIGLIAFLMWMGAAGDDRNYKTYAIYFIGDISGIKPGSAVKFKGLEVGAVQSLRFDEQNPNFIRVLASIDAAAPITEETVATVRFQDVIGTSAIALQNVDIMPEGMVVRKDNTYPVIPSRPSDLEKVIASLPEAMETVRKLGEQGSKLLNDDNLAALTAILSTLDTSLKTFDATMQIISRTADKSEKLLDGNVIVDLRDALSEARTALREIRLLAKTLRNDPSQVIRQPKYKGYTPAQGDARAR